MGGWARCTSRTGFCPGCRLDRSPLSLRAARDPPGCRLQFLGDQLTVVRDVDGGTCWRTGSRGTKRAVLVEEVSGDEDVDVHVEDSWDDQGGVIVDQPPRSHLQTLPPSLPTSASPSTSVSSAETMQIDPTMEISLPREPDPY
jgi:hypothetical protein